MDRLPRGTTRLPVVGAVCALALASCDGERSPTTGVPDEAGTSSLLVPVPEAIGLARAIDPATLSVSVSIDGRSLEPSQRANVWSVEASVPPGEAVVVVIEWFAPYFVDELPIAFLSRPLGPFERDADIEIDRTDYETGAGFDGGRLDADRDGRSNLAELEAGTDPTDPASPGGTVEDAPSPTVPAEPAPDVVFVRAEVSVPYVDPATPPEIDGFNEAPQWDGATFGDNAGEPLAIDRLIIDRDRAAEAADGESGYRWAAMHDGTFLYLYVQFEDERRTPFRDSGESWFEDDMLNLQFDGDASRGERLEGVDGGDDRYIVIPQTSARNGDDVQAFAPFSLAPVYPASLEFGVCLQCPGRASGWELKIAIEELGITVGEPFGFEVQIDQDLDGGQRDVRWGWASPSIAQRDGGAVFRSPRLNGTLILLAPR